MNIKSIKVNGFVKIFILVGIILSLFVSIVLRKSSVSYIPLSEENMVKVIQVIDGDTIKIKGGEMVRYIGIDAPETVDPRKSVECIGKEGFRRNKELVEGKMVRLEKDVVDRDKYHRLLRYVWIDDMLVNAELVKQGFAYAYSFPPDIKYHYLFTKAQQEAMQGKRGLWRSCGY
ncbi:MAG TPA: thermonuclease family protein [Patescibacteria group bacterium]|nr:thermonuclease family protein [Patescibacteria group bacterium]